MSDTKLHLTRAKGLSRSQETLAAMLRLEHSKVQMNHYEGASFDGSIDLKSSDLMVKMAELVTDDLMAIRQALGLDRVEPRPHIPNQLFGEQLRIPSRDDQVSRGA